MQLAHRHDRSTPRPRWVRILAHCHDALTAYGAQRLEPAGWRELGIGSLPAASPGFRELALSVATGWATYEARDSWDMTIADIALRQPHWFSEKYHAAIDVLAGSRLDLYSVDDDGTPGTTLRRVRDGLAFRPMAVSDDVTPPGATLVARLARGDDHCALLSSAVLAPASAGCLFGSPAPRDADDWSRRLLDALLRQFAAADLDGRGTTRESRLAGVPLRQLVRLHRALRSLEVTLDGRPGSVARHHALDGRSLLAERRGRQWRVVIGGPRPASVERTPVAAAHPVDVEIMRQIGATQGDGVLWFEGPLDDLVTVCASAAVARSKRAA